MRPSVSHFLTALAIGSLLGDTFMHLLPVIYGTHSHKTDTHQHDESHHQHTHEFDYGIVIMFGFLLCFFVEMMIRLRQQKSDEKGHHSHSHIKAFGWLNLFSDGIHNFMDGMGLAGAFHVSQKLGLATTLCICFHELPQELSDFGVLLSAGFSVKRALFFNFLSGVVAVLGCSVGIMINQQSIVSESWAMKLLNEKALVAITAGSFLYIIASMTNELWSQIFEPEKHIAPSETVNAPESKSQKSTKKKKPEKQTIPETSTSKDSTSAIIMSVVGVFCGLLIMYLIGHLEHDVLNWF